MSSEWERTASLSECQSIALWMQAATGYVQLETPWFLPDFTLTLLKKKIKFQMINLNAVIERSYVNRAVDTSELQGLNCQF